MNAHPKRELPWVMLSEPEERANRWTHAIGFLLSLGGVLLLAKELWGTQDLLRVLACALYGTSLLLVYAMSALSHCNFSSPRRDFFRSLDQGCIYFLIVGTYTPLSVIYLQARGFWILLGSMWALAIVGFVSKVLFNHRVNSVSVIIYVLLGWLPILTLPWSLFLTPAVVLWGVLAGGICYTLGTLFLANDKRVRYFHALWHLWVIAGSAVHFLTILHAITTSK